MMGALNRWDRVAFHWLLHLDVIRGQDSTGVCAIHDNLSVKTYKEVGRPEYLYDKFPVEFKDDVYARADTLCLIGHNRAATQGEVNAENAHPFDMGRIVGAHNGTILQWSLRSLNGYLQHAIDSQIIFQHINDTGNVQEVWDVADGAMALTWWDRETNSLMVVRNSQRPLHYCLSKDNKTIYWASKPWMLEAALGTCRIKHHQIQTFEVDKLYQISKDKKGIIQAKETPLNPFVEWWKASPTSAEVKYSPSRNYTDHLLEIVEWVREGPKDHNGYFVGINDLGEEIVVDISNPMEEVVKNRYKYIREKCDENKPYFNYTEIDVTEHQGVPVIKAISLRHSKDVNKFQVLEVDGKKFDEKTFKEKYHEGCCLCGSSISFEEAMNSVFVSDVILCPECKDSAIVQDWLQTHEDKKEVNNGN